MAIFSIEIEPVMAIALIDELRGQGIVTDSNVESITIRPYPQQIPILEQICQRHRLALLDGLPPEQAEALIDSGMTAPVIAARKYARALRREWQQVRVRHDTPY